MTNRKGKASRKSEQEIQEEAQSLALELLAVPYEQRGQVISRVFAGRSDVDNMTRLTGTLVGTLCVMIDSVKAVEGGPELMANITTAISTRILMESLEM